MNWKKFILLYSLSFILINNIAAQSAQSTEVNNPKTGSTRLRQLEESLDSIIESTMREQHIPGAAFSIVTPNKVLLQKGYGFSSLGEDIAYINPDSSIFRIGSITKTFTTLALLQLIEAGKIGLHEDVNSKLKRVKVPINFPQVITPFHLMTHTAGFDELSGRRVFQESNQIPLDQFLADRLIRIREPGLVPAYSTYGIALAGLLVEDLTGMSLEEYMKKNIWLPAKMQRTSIQLPEEHNAQAVIGYEYYNGINIPQPWEWYHTFPASSINSTTSDMGRYMQLHLNLGKYNGQQILSRDRAEQMQKKQFSIHPEVDGFAFGFYERKRLGLSTINHGGEMLGFSSFMVLVPNLQMGIFVVHHHEGTNLRNLVINTILEHFIEQEQAQNIPKITSDEVDNFAGSYRWLSNCQTCPNSDSQQTWELKVESDQTLSGFGRRFYQVGPLLFKSYDGQRTMGFMKDAKGAVQYMSLGNINVFEKVK